MDSNTITTPEAEKSTKRVKKSISKEVKKAKTCPEKETDCKKKTESETDTASEDETTQVYDSGTNTAPEQEVRPPSWLNLTILCVAADYVEMLDELEKFKKNKLPASQK
ncbi:hypothetical protein TKK_0002845 [Trichogramma kaykai]